MRRHTNAEKVEEILSGRKVGPCLRVGTVGYAMRIDENDEVKLFAAEHGKRGLLDFFSRQEK